MHRRPVPTQAWRLDLGDAERMFDLLMSPQIKILLLWRRDGDRGDDDFSDDNNKDKYSNVKNINVDDGDDDDDDDDDDNNNTHDRKNATVHALARRMYPSAIVVYTDDPDDVDAIAAHYHLNTTGTHSDLPAAIAHDTVDDVHLTAVNVRLGDVEELVSAVSRLAERLRARAL